MPGLTALAFVVAASAPGPAVTHAPPGPGAYDNPATAIPMPTCPDWFSVETATATLFRCTASGPYPQGGTMEHIAKTTGCGPRYWNVGPEVEALQNGRSFVVRWTCQHK